MTTLGYSLPAWVPVDFGEMPIDEIRTTAGRKTTGTFVGMTKRMRGCCATHTEPSAVACYAARPPAKVRVGTGIIPG